MISKPVDLETSYLKRPRRQKPSQSREFVDSDSRKEGQPARAPARRRSRRKPKWPDLSPFDLTNPNDIFSAHQMLAGWGLWQDGYEGLFKFAMAVVMAMRLANRNPAGYLARIVERGLWGDGLHGPAERDELAAKAIMQELDQ